MADNKELGVGVRYPINGALHETGARSLGEEELLWVLLDAGDIVLTSG